MTTFFSGQICPENFQPNFARNFSAKFAQKKILPKKVTGSRFLIFRQ